MPAQVSQITFFRGFALYMWITVSTKQARPLWSVGHQKQQKEHSRFLSPGRNSVRGRTFLMHTPHSMQMFAVKTQPGPGRTHPHQKPDGAGSKPSEQDGECVPSHLLSPRELTEVQLDTFEGTCSSAAHSGLWFNTILLLQGTAVQLRAAHASLCSPRQGQPPQDRWAKSRTLARLSGHLVFRGQLLPMCLSWNHSASLVFHFCLGGIFQLLPGLQLQSPFHVFKAWLKPLGTPLLLLQTDGSHKWGKEDCHEHGLF